MAYTTLSPDIKYPQHPTVPGAHTRGRLLEGFNPIGISRVDDYQLLYRALQINHRPSVIQALAVGAPLMKPSRDGDDCGSILYSIPRLFHSGLDAYGPEQRGIEYLNDMTPQISALPPPIRSKTLAQMMVDAVHQGSWEMTRVLRSLGGSFDALPDKYGYIAPRRNVLHAVARSTAARRDEFLRQLPAMMDVQAGLLEVEVDTEGFTPMLSAADMADELCLKCFLDWGADHMAVSNDHSGLLHVAVCGSSFQAKVIPMVASLLGSKRYAEVANLVNDNGYYPIHEAVGYRMNNIDWKLLSPNGDIDVHSRIDCLIQPDTEFLGLSPLGLAISLGDVPATVSLVRQGASLAKLTPSGHTGWHLLAQLSLSVNHEDIRSARALVRILDKMGVSSETVINGQSPMSLESSDWYRSVLSQRRQKALLDIDQSTARSSRVRAVKI